MIRGPAYSGFSKTFIKGRMINIYFGYSMFKDMLETADQRTSHRQSINCTFLGNVSAKINPFTR